MIIAGEINLRTTLAAILKIAGYEVKSSPDFAEAIHRLSEGCHDRVDERAYDALHDPAFDLIIVDLKKADPSGMELVREINNLQPGLPIVLLTAAGFDESAARANGIKILAHLLKPVEPALIVSCVEEALNKNPRIRLSGGFPRGAIEVPGE